MSRMSMHSLVLQEEEGEALWKELTKEKERSEHLRAALRRVTVAASVMDVGAVRRIAGAALREYYGTLPKTPPGHAPGSGPQS